jgi:diaminohydroxyphosphoribosylaminopyrimidine deaminase/5-amino-6-(5-phosphoribosylamino)uracil reductase
MINQKDRNYLQMAYALAEKAKGWASPNPYVGAVIVHENKIVGWGYHEKPGAPHAEVIAIKKAGSFAKGSTAYITLEPCIHWGRTPPCVDKILQTGLKRVVVSALDPNPLVYRKGIKKMKQAGLDVSYGLFKEKNDILNETYNKYITQKKPFVALKTAVTLDGKTATKKMDSKWISSPETREYIHLLRGEFDAIMVGINTIIKDNPHLTVRHSNWKGKSITRIILDSNLRFPKEAKILKTLKQGRILIFTHVQSPSRKIDTLKKMGFEVVSFSPSSSGINLNKVLSWLGKHEISSLLVEGGGTLHTAFLGKKLADKIFITLSPKLIGGRDSLSFFQGKGVDTIKDSLGLHKTTILSIRDDIIFEGYF